MATNTRTAAETAIDNMLDDLEDIDETVQVAVKRHLEPYAKATRDDDYGVTFYTFPDGSGVWARSGGKEFGLITG